MRNSTLLILLFIATFSIKAQNYNPIINYAFNGTPKNGVKIKTNLPYLNGMQMPTIIIEGYNYHASQSIGLIMNWYIYGGNFIRQSVSSFGAYTPEIKLLNEAGKVVIFINDKKYYNRFTIRGYATGTGERPEMFQNWSIVDEAPNGKNEVTVPYRNAFGSKVSIGTNTRNDANLQIGSDTRNGLIMLGGGKGYSAIGSTRSDGGLILGKNIYTKYDNVSENYKGRVGSTSAYGFSGIKLNHNGVIDFFGKNGNVTADEIANSPQNIKMKIDNLGNVGIGTIDTKGYKLAVAGKSIAEEVTVKLKSNWPDYVFEKDYDLPKLKEVEKQIKERGHLKNIPTAEEVKENGIDLGEMNKKLLQKIEELTLYTINQQKRIEKIEGENYELKEIQKRMKVLEGKINLLFRKID